MSEILSQGDHQYAMGRQEDQLDEEIANWRNRLATAVAEIARLQAIVDQFLSAHAKFREACLAQRSGRADKGEPEFRDGLRIIRETAEAARNTQ